MESEYKPYIEQEQVREGLDSLSVADSGIRSQLTRIKDILRLGPATFTRVGFVRFLITPLDAFDQHSALALLLKGKIDKVHGVVVSEYEGMGF